MLNLAWQDTGHRAQRHCAYRLTNRLVNTAHFPGIHEVLHGRSFGHPVHVLRSWIREPHVVRPSQSTIKQAYRTAIRKIRWHCSFTSPFCFYGVQLSPHQPKICSLTPKKLDLCLDVCQNTIDLLNRDREPDRSPMNCLPAFLAVHYAHRGRR
jgi:hypothetical protein